MPILRRSLLGSALALPVMAAPVMAAAPPMGGQAPSFFRYKVGDFQVTAIHDGIAFRSLDGFVPNAPPGALEQAMRAAFLPADKLPITFTTLVVNTGSKLVLIDSGNGEFAAPTAGKWAENFRAAGFEPSQVDTVIISHFHGDHINGLRGRDGSAVFPNAQVMVPEAEWAYWTSESEEARAREGLKGTFANTKRVFGPMQKDVATYRWDQEVVPGITALRADGHTPGHTAFAITSGDARLMVLSDTTNHPALFARHPTWSAVFDQDGPAAAATRIRLLDLAATERMQVAFYHAPFPATGHIERDGDGFRLAPLMWTPQA